MGEGHLRQRLQFLRFRRGGRRVAGRWVNDAPRSPPIPAAGRASDASSLSLTEGAYRPTGDAEVEGESEMETDVGSEVELASGRNAATDVTCVICLDDVAVGSRTVALPGCGHALWHARCARQWLRQARRCPLCAAVVVTASAHAAGRGQLSQSTLVADVASADADDPLSNTANLSASMSMSMTVGEGGEPSATTTTTTTTAATAAAVSVVAAVRSRRLTSGGDESAPPRARELPWTLSERRVHERAAPSPAQRGRRSASQDLGGWVLSNRRISLATRPARRRRYVRLPQSFSLIRR